MLFISSTIIALKGFNKSCFGPSNQILAKYFDVEPWKIDWFVNIQSVVFFPFSILLCLITTKMGYRLLVVLTLVQQIPGFVITSYGMSSQNGYCYVIIGQAVMGACNVLSWALPATTASVWFGKGEVTAVVACHVVAKGLGESLGSFLPTAYVDVTSERIELGGTWMRIFILLGLLALLLNLIAFCVVRDRPHTPPSLAQYKLEVQRRMTGPVMDKTKTKDFINSVEHVASTLKSVFLDPVFVAVWLLFGANAPVLSCSNVLLSSLVLKEFPDEFEDPGSLDETVGFVLMISWAMFCVGALVCTPVINCTRRFKGVVVFGQVFLLLACACIYAGVFYNNLKFIYLGTMLQGFMVSWVYTSLVELISEVSYPNSSISVTLLCVVSPAIFSIVYPLVGRFLLERFGGKSCALFPCATVAVCCVTSCLISPVYRRQKSYSKDDHMPLINSDD